MEEKPKEDVEAQNPDDKEVTKKKKKRNKKKKNKNKIEGEGEVEVEEEAKNEGNISDNVIKPPLISIFHPQ